MPETTAAAIEMLDARIADPASSRGGLSLGHVADGEDSQLGLPAGRSTAHRLPLHCFRVQLVVSAQQACFGRRRRCRVSLGHASCPSFQNTKVYAADRPMTSTLPRSRVAGGETGRAFHHEEGRHWRTHSAQR